MSATTDGPPSLFKETFWLLQHDIVRKKLDTNGRNGRMPYELWSTMNSRQIGPLATCRLAAVGAEFRQVISRQIERIDRSLVAGSSIWWKTSLIPYCNVAIVQTI